MRIVGVDPGLKGAVALFDTKAGTLRVEALPVIREQRSTKVKSFIDEGRLSDLVRALRPEVAFVEDVFSSDQMGVVSAFSFGEGKGILKGVLAAHGCERRYVSPSVWKGDLGCSADKHQTRKVARLLLPGCVSILRSEGKHEAALIGLWGCLSVGIKPARFKPSEESEG